MEHAARVNFFPGTHEGTHGALPTVGYSQVELVGWAQFQLLTVLIECLTVLLEYIDIFIPVTGHTKLFKRQFV